MIALGGCGKGGGPSASTPSASAAGESDGASFVVGAGDDAGPGPMDAREKAQWAAAKEGEPEELGRLVGLVGCEGLRERAETAELRVTALEAMAYCPDFGELPWLAQVGTTGKDDEAKLALEAAVELAARPRRSTDPEDAEELHAGCGALLELAKTKEAARDRRVLAVRALRMLAERGCVKRADIPTDVDAK
ncbi:MAG TPA: hypothetical protein VGG39_13455 [Polyangiaceae bacterium]